MKFHHRGTINTELATERKNRKNPEHDKEEKEKRVIGLTYIVNRIGACMNDNDIMVLYL